MKDTNELELQNTSKRFIVKNSKSRNLKIRSKHFLPVLTIVLLIVLWELLTRITAIPNYILPAPSVILKETFVEYQSLLTEGWVTTYELIGGYILAIIVGIPCAVLIVYSTIFERTIYPILVFMQTVPKIAIAPLFIVWFGIGTLPKVLVAFSMAFFPIVIDTVAGLRAINPDMISLARSMGATRLEILRKIQFPNALPHIFSGLKVAITLAVVGAIVGEFVGADKGLGYLLLVANGNIDTTFLFAALIVLTVIGLLFFYLVEWLEKKIIPWNRSVEEDK